MTVQYMNTGYKDPTRKFRTIHYSIKRTQKLKYVSQKGEILTQKVVIEERETKMEVVIR